MQNEIFKQIRIQISTYFQKLMLKLHDEWQIWIVFKKAIDRSPAMAHNIAEKHCRRESKACTKLGDGLMNDESACWGSKAVPTWPKSGAFFEGWTPESQARSNFWLVIPRGWHPRSNFFILFPIFSGSQLCFKILGRCRGDVWIKLIPNANLPCVNPQEVKALSKWMNQESRSLFYISFKLGGVYAVLETSFLVF